MTDEAIKVSTADATLYARASGAGSILVLLPGMGRPATDLDPLADLLANAGFRVIQPDTRGDGRSIGRLEGITLHDFAADIVAVIEEFGETGVTIIGHAFGNRVARTVAADRPDLVARVVLLGCSGMVQPSPEIAEAIRLAQAVDTPEPIREQAVRAAWYGPGADITVWMSGWNQPLIKASLAAAAATNIADWWTAGSARVLIVQGLADVSAPPENGRALKAEIAARAELVELPSVGHSVAVEAPDAVAKAILAYLAQARDAQSA